jgi:hypothetical protein
MKKDLVQAQDITARLQIINANLRTENEEILSDRETFRVEAANVRAELITLLRNQAITRLQSTESLDRLRQVHQLAMESP